MAPDRLGSLVGLCAVPLTIALSLSLNASADTPSWNGEYAITFIVGPKSGTSMAAGDPEGQHTETYGFRSSCTSGNASRPSSAAHRRAIRRSRNRCNSHGMGRPGRKSAISSGTA